MEFQVQLARFNPDPELNTWITGAVQKLLDQAHKDAAEQLTRRDAELRLAQTKIQALTLELAHLRRMRFGAKSEAFSGEERDLFQDTLVSDIAAAEAKLAERQADEPETPAAAKETRPRAGRQPLPDHLPRIEHRHEPESCTCGQCGSDLISFACAAGRAASCLVAAERSAKTSPNNWM